MDTDFYATLRAQVGATLEQATDAMAPPELYQLVVSGIEAERAKMQAQGGAGSILTLNALLDHERSLRVKVLGGRPDQIAA